MVTLFGSNHFKIGGSAVRQASPTLLLSEYNNTVLLANQFGLSFKIIKHTSVLSKYSISQELSYMNKSTSVLYKMMPIPFIRAIEKLLCTLLVENTPHILGHRKEHRSAGTQKLT